MAAFTTVRYRSERMFQHFINRRKKIKLNSGWWILFKGDPTALIWLILTNKQIPMMTFLQTLLEVYNFFVFFPPLSLLFARSCLHSWLDKRKLVIYRIGRQSACFPGRKRDVIVSKQDIETCIYCLASCRTHIHFFFSSRSQKP